MVDIWPWLALVLLGVFHGLNPAMGWLFAVARGLQENRRGAVFEALLPIALGHGASVGLIVILVSGAALVIDPSLLRWLGAAALVSFGAYKAIKSRSHPRWVGMRVSLPELAAWSFIMSTAHGAGLMLFPVMVSLPSAASHRDHFADPGPSSLMLSIGTAVVLVHTVAMLAAMGGIAVLVYEKLGLAVLRQAWVNLDLIWAFALMAAGVFTLIT